MAAVLACGAGAVLSHRSAAGIWQILPLDRARPVEVLVPGRFAPSRPGILARHTAALAGRDVRTLGGIPLTRPARTLLDLGSVVSAARLERAVAEAHARGLAGEPELREQLRRHRGRRGAGALRALLDRQAGPAFTRSEAERRLLSLIRAAGVPEPEVNARVGSYEVDFLWRAERVIAETDGYAFHSSRAAFERDRDRDNELQARGYRVLRFSWRQVVSARGVVRARLRRSLRVI